MWLYASRYWQGVAIKAGAWRGGYSVAEEAKERIALGDYQKSEAMGEDGGVVIVLGEKAGYMRPSTAAMSSIAVTTRIMFKKKCKAAARAEH